MILHLVRTRFDDACTLGELYLDGVHFCATLELPVKDGAPGSAIPAGRFPVTFTPSPRAKAGTLWTPDAEARLPLLSNVPGRTDIRIHGGNHPSDTEGCILVGQHDGATETLVDSRAMLTALLDRLAPAWADGVTIEVE